ncbi:MAG: TrkA family potassium uptake protein [Vulcanimicrobiota bacterium]
MKDKPLQVLVIGLGRFGRSLALSLTELGAEVMGMDVRQEAVSEVADRLIHSAVADSTDEKVMREVGVDQFDATVCAVGSDIEASLMTVLLLKEHGSKNLVAKAANALHGRVLERIGADRVIFPEREVALRLARDFLAPRDFVEVVPLTVQHSMFELQAPAHFAGCTLQELDLRSRFGLTVVAIRRGDDTVVSPAAAEVIRRQDLMVVVGDRNRAQDLLTP